MRLARPRSSPSVCGPRNSSSVMTAMSDFGRSSIFRTGYAANVRPGRRCICVTKPFLLESLQHLGDVVLGQVEHGIAIGFLIGPRHQRIDAHGVNVRRRLGFLDQHAEQTAFRARSTPARRFAAAINISSISCSAPSPRVYYSEPRGLFFRSIRRLRIYLVTHRRIGEIDITTFSLIQGNANDGSPN